MVAVALPRPVSLREKLLTVGLGLGGRGVLGLGLGLGRSAVSAAGFVGAYDAVPSIVAAYGMRRLLTSYTGSLLRLRRSSDNAESDFGYDANGDLDAAAIASFVGAGAGYVATWYDQSGGSKNAAQTTAGSQPLYVASGQNSKPVLRYDGGDGLVTGFVFSLAAKTMSMFMTAKSTTNNNGVWFSLQRTELPDYTSGVACYNTGVADSNDLVLGIGSGGIGASYYYGRRYGSLGSSFMLFDYLASTSSVEAYKNSASQSLTAFGSLALSNWLSGGSGNHRLTVGARAYGASNALTAWHNGDMAEFVICDSVLSSGNRQAAEAAANAYWSIY